jgi:hypothetical protein
MVARMNTPGCIEGHDTQHRVSEHHSLPYLYRMQVRPRHILPELAADKPGCSRNL